MSRTCASASVNPSDSLFICAGTDCSPLRFARSSLCRPLITSKSPFFLRHTWIGAANARSNLPSSLLTTPFSFAPSLNCGKSFDNFKSLIFTSVTGLSFGAKSAFAFSGTAFSLDGTTALLPVVDSTSTALVFP